MRPKGQGTQSQGCYIRRDRQHPDEMGAVSGARRQTRQQDRESHPLGRPPPPR